MATALYQHMRNDHWLLEECCTHFEIFANVVQSEINTVGRSVEVHARAILILRRVTSDDIEQRFRWLETIVDSTSYDMPCDDLHR